MGVFERMRNGLIQFMYGRNGMDQLNRALLVAYLVVWMLRVLTAASIHGPFYRVWDVLEWVLFILIMFRMFSKNLYRRREENQKWVNWWWRVKNAGGASRARRADKEHKYFVCKNCKTVCRVPVGKGKIIITCPKCGAQIHAKS